jgi:UDP-N-acetylglucosamine 4-epimerase
MKVVITGCAGFIGSNLAVHCLNLGWDVVGIDDMSNGHREFVDDRVDLIERQFDSGFNDVLKWSERPDVVVHLAALPRVSYSVENPAKTFEVNVLRSMSLIKSCCDNGIPIVFASSSSVYGGADTLPTVESDQKKPKSPYALHKSTIEDYLELYGKLYGLKSISLRFFNVFGKNQLGSSPYSCAVSAWLTAIHSGQPMRSDGDGKQSRDLCHVDNVTDACVRSIKCLSRDPSHTLLGARYNVACGKSVTNNEIIDYMMKRYPGATKIDSHWRAGDVMHTLASIESARSGLGYVPMVEVWTGIERTCDWYDANWDAIKNMKKGL